MLVGAAVGSREGAAVGKVSGIEVGSVLGVAVGGSVGKADGTSEGSMVGKSEGKIVGEAEGSMVGIEVGSRFGAANGLIVGSAEGSTVGCEVGWIVGGCDVTAVVGAVRDAVGDASTAAAPRKKQKTPSIAFFAVGFIDLSTDVEITPTLCEVLLVPLYATAVPYTLKVLQRGGSEPRIFFAKIFSQLRRRKQQRSRTLRASDRRRCHRGRTGSSMGTLGRNLSNSGSK